jgi:hypothetical protein
MENMAYSETGHNINVAHLNQLNETIITFGEKYNPAKNRIKLLELQALYTAGNQQIAFVQTSKNNYSTKVDDREDAYKNVKTFSTQIIGIMSGTNVSKALIKDAKSINKKIQGTRIDNPNTPPTTNQEGEPIEDNSIENDPLGKKHSTSRQSHISIQENFADLVDLLENAENYDPNEDEFKIPSLKDYSENLKNANQRIDTAVAQVKEKRIDRNQFLYTPETGLVDTALEAKDYIKGLFGASSPEFKAADAISFRNFKQ